MPKPAWKEDRVRIRILEILRTTDRGIWARVGKTGKLAWLSKAYSEIVPGAAIIPGWMAKKILGGRDEKSMPCM